MRPAARATLRPRLPLARASAHRARLACNPESPMRDAVTSALLKAWLCRKRATARLRFSCLTATRKAHSSTSTVRRLQLRTRSTSESEKSARVTLGTLANKAWTTDGTPLDRGAGRSGFTWKPATGTRPTGRNPSAALKRHLIRLRSGM